MELLQGAAILAGILIILLGGGAVLLLREIRVEAAKHRPHVEVASSPARALELAFDRMRAFQAVVVYRDASSVTFQRKERPNHALGLFLLCLGLIPGLLYFGLFGKTRTLTLVASPSAEGTLLVFSGDDLGARADLVRHFKT